jgi:hypothetical protein
MLSILALLVLLTPGILLAEGGETIETATVIPGLPYVDLGHTCDKVNDYDEICPYSGSTAPDVVYSYTPSANVSIWCSLCESSYDTKLYVYADSVGNLVGCNDDSCYETWQSLLELPLAAGTTYYFIVDGYAAECGEYVLEMREATAPCVVECPPGSLQEGEPPCHEGYVDVYNSGCYGSGWTPIEAQQDGCADMCGRLCGWGYASFDTDWYRCSAAGGLVTVTVRAEFYPMLSLFYVPDCSPLQYIWDAAAPCETAILQREFAPGEEFWISVLPYENSADLPESDYHLHVCGIQGGPTPIDQTSWGRIKSKYR